MLKASLCQRRFANASVISYTPTTNPSIIRI
jgi:hypothetical protein